MSHIKKYAGKAMEEQNKGINDDIERRSEPLTIIDKYLKEYFEALRGES